MGPCPSRDFYLSDNAKMKELRQKYLQHVEKMFRLAGASEKRARADAAAVLRIETSLARAAMDVVKRRDPANVNNVRSLAEVQTAVPSFDWKAYLAAVRAPKPRHLIVSSPDFLRGLEQSLRKEPLEAWKAYLRWWSLHGNAQYLSRAFVDADFEFFARTMSGAEELLPRWRRCVTWADRDLGEAVGQAYVEVAFPPDHKTGAAAAGEGGGGGPWPVHRPERLDGERRPRTQAQEKLEGHRGQDRLPGALARLLDGHHRAYQPGSERPCRDRVRAASQLSKIDQPVDRTDWTMTPADGQRLLRSAAEHDQLPAGILQPPYFDQRIGGGQLRGIGMIIGTRSSTGFDDQGRKFDAKGNLRDWWTPEDARRYDERGKCISDQYTQEIPDLGVKQNGLLTQGEDTADNGGMRLAYLAMASTLAAQGSSVDAKGPMASPTPSVSSSPMPSAGAAACDRRSHGPWSRPIPTRCQSTG
jgi:predicted metalloendopeptidase